jgi:hypothetical protein
MPVPFFSRSRLAAGAGLAAMSLVVACASLPGTSAAPV